MISPEEVEQVLMSHPEVEEAAVIGVPDVEWGEQVRALVVRRWSRISNLDSARSMTQLDPRLRLDPPTRVSEAELIDYCRQKLASFKLPRSVVFIDELPRNALGKVLKRELRQQYGYPVEAR
jgi:acyl-CoA synthetase (AMP-forming)/AMP-acid ligase II